MCNQDFSWTLTVNPRIYFSNLCVCFKDQGNTVPVTRMWLRKIMTIASLLWISGCTRPDTLVIWNGFSGEIKLSKVSIDELPDSSFTPSVLHGAVAPLKGDSLIFEGETNNDSPVIKIEWTRRNAPEKSSCSYKKNRRRCEVHIFISESGITCGGCDESLSF